ncbi:MAG: hypothetical protein FWC92_02220 [Defluviitaleaceae bacterium]|nr:hypothetical protein [Defluviitaleaceae bacterium]
MDKQQYAGPERTPHEVIKILPESQQIKALLFIELGLELECKAQTRYAHANKYWRCVFSRKKPQRVLFTVECTDEWWRIKACLWNIDAYSDYFASCNKRIKNDILSAYDCKSCNSHCKGGAGFSFEDKQYQKCVGLVFYFSSLTDDEWDNVAMLIRKEFEASKGATT